MRRIAFAFAILTAIAQAEDFGDTLRALVQSSAESPEAFLSTRGELIEASPRMERWRATRTLPGFDPNRCEVHRTAPYDWRYQCLRPDLTFDELVRRVRASFPYEVWVVDPVGRNAVFFRFQDQGAEPKSWRIQVFRQPLSVSVFPPRETVSAALARVRAIPGRAPLSTPVVEEYGTDERQSVLSVQNATGRALSLVLSPGDKRRLLSPNATQEILLPSGSYEIAGTSLGNEDTPAYGTLVLQGATRCRLTFR